MVLDHGLVPVFREPLKTSPSLYSLADVSGWLRLGWIRLQWPKVPLCQASFSWLCTPKRMWGLSGF